MECKPPDCECWLDKPVCKECKIRCVPNDVDSLGECWIELIQKDLSK